MQLQPGRYRHYKGPEYRVFAVARHSETEEPVVFYRTEDGTAISSGLLRDYMPRNGTIVFGKGVNRHLLKLPIMDDTHQEGAETFFVRLLNPFPKGSVYISGESVGEVRIIDSDRDTLRSRVEFGAAEYDFYETDGVVQLTLAEAADEWLLSISDQGKGVPEPLLEAIFQPFFRAPQAVAGAAERAGFGLGLALARRQIIATGGSIRACPAAGGGLCMEIRLPKA